MIHALLHHKLDDRTTNAQRREDTLTASVFGTLVWMEAWDMLAKWLDVPAPSPGEVTDCWFWPRLAGSVEPDVILRMGSNLVVVEAKLRSNRHDKSAAIGEEDVADDEPYSAVDQLERQFVGITTPAPVRQRYPDDLEQAIRDCELIQIYLVDRMRLRRAEKEVEQSRNRMRGRHRLRPPVTWQSLSARLTPRAAQPRWERDLLDYFRMIDLDTFNGINGSEFSGRSAPIFGWRIHRRPQKSLTEIAATISASPHIRRLQEWRSLERTQ